MATITHSRPATVPHPLRHGAWFVFGSALGFAVPYVGVSVLGLQHDVYYLIYFATTLALIGAYARIEAIDLRAVFVRRWKWSLLIALPVTAFVVANVMSANATVRPGGAYLAFEVAWRGIGYGVIDALLLTAFPCMVAYNVLRGRIRGWRGHLRYVALALPLVMVITATYHLGYPQYREDGVRQPEIGNTIISIPAFATANPIGSVIAHASMHTTAVLHSYETDVFLPPVTTVNDEAP
jgi:hypothetical protein